MGILRKWTLRQKEAYRKLLGRVTEGNNTCGKEGKRGKEVGLGRESELQCTSKGSLRSLQRVPKMGWPFRCVLNWVRE